jgi:arabinose-5-phosphate isomerase
MSSLKDIAVKCFQDEAQAILNLIPQLDENFDKAVEIIYDCKGKIIITGVGKSGHVGAKMAATLSSTGTPAFFINPLDVFHGDLGVMTKDDVVIAISNSGQTDELLRFIPYLLEHNIPLIGISGNPESMLATYSNSHLTVAVNQEACPLNLAPTSSSTATLVMGDALACALIKVRNFNASDFAQYHPGGSLGKRLLATARDVMRSNDLPVIEPSMKLGEAIIHVSKGKLGLGIVVVNNKIEGLITDGDVRRAMERLQDKFFNVPVADVMTVSPKCVSPDTKIAKIQSIMHKNKIHTVLVVDDEKHLLGVVDHFSCMF